MAGKLIELNEAAKLLGVSPDELIEMRSAGDIHGYRDGASWKFKMEEIERVAEERGVELGSNLGSASDSGGSAFADDFDDMLADDDDSILVSDSALGRSGESTSSTIIGKGAMPVDSDIQLGSATSDVQLAAEAAGTDLNLVSGGSDVLGDTGTKKKGATASDTGKMLGGGSDLSLGDDELAFGGSAIGSGTGSALDMDDSDDELVLGSSAIASGISSLSGDSGINLSPTDSGLSLEDEPLDLGGSSVESLELPEDDDIISLDEEPTDPDAATQLKADDEFLLTPVEEMADDESSGSQVIALEDSEIYADESAATMLGAGGFEQPALVAEDADAYGAMQGFGQAPVGAAQPIPMGAPMMAPTLPEAPYSVWNVMGLFFVFCFLAVTGMFMVDLMRNMWSFDSTGGVTTGLMNTLVKAIGLDKS